MQKRYVNKYYLDLLNRQFDTQTRYANK